MSTYYVPGTVTGICTTVRNKMAAVSPCLQTAYLWKNLGGNHKNKKWMWNAGAIGHIITALIKLTVQVKLSKLLMGGEVKVDFGSRSNKFD